MKNKRIIEALEMMGYEILHVGKPNANGPDAHVRKGALILRVEFKKARPMKRSTQIHPVEPDRRHDDLIAIEFPSGYVLVEPMGDHLKCCAPTGGRTFFGVY